LDNGSRDTKHAKYSPRKYSFDNNVPRKNIFFFNNVLRSNVSRNIRFSNNEHRTMDPATIDLAKIDTHNIGLLNNRFCNIGSRKNGPRN
jgi:hypothetical protein